MTTRSCFSSLPLPVLLLCAQPRLNGDLMAQLVKQNATVFSMDSLLRTLSRGQSFDVLSSQARTVNAEDFGGIPSMIVLYLKCASSKGNPCVPAMVSGLCVYR